jgi:hypothetical protein
MIDTQLPGYLYLRGENELQSVALLLIIAERDGERYVVVVYNDGVIRAVSWLSTRTIKNYYTRVIPELVGESHG